MSERSGQTRGIVLIEDDDVTRERLRQKLDELAGYAVLAACRSVAEARDALRRHSPDLLLVDIELPDGSGLDVIAAHTAERPDVPVLVISVLGDERSVLSAIEAGASGYLLKSDTSLMIEQCLTELNEGGAPISAGIAKHLIRRLRPEPKAPDAEAHLSERELEVLQLAAKGYSYQDIAELLGVKPNTISSYTRRMYQKLSVHSRSEAVFEGLRMGLVEKPER